MQIRYRRGTPRDIYSAVDVLDRDRSLFSRRVWNLLPGALADLIKRDRILICLCEEVDSGHIVFVGGSGFLQECFLKSALEGEGALLEPAIAAELEGRPAFQNYKQVAEANRRDDLRLLNFFGSPPPVDFGDSNTFANLGQITEAWNFFHKGFSIHEIWCETSNQLLSGLYLRLGLRIHGQRPLPDGGTAMVAFFTREDALATTPSWPGSAMFSPRPHLGFTRADQKLLELALLDHSDRDAAAALGISIEAVKKRWRSIYAKVARMEPALLRADLNGADQRRTLFQSLRSNLQELRPY